MDSLPPRFKLSADVRRALQMGQPVLALESAVITHGLPSPSNLSLARDMQAEARNEGVTPATIAVLNGQIQIGLTDSDLEELAGANAMKVSQRDFAAAITKGVSGGTTVAGTMFAAHKAGIKVFSTGGIGGVQKEQRFDVSPDMLALANTPMIVVCAGAKSILDLPATLEYLETVGVPVVGYQTDEFPAFFSRQSGLKTSAQVDSPGEAAAFARAHWDLGIGSGVLICQPVPSGDEISRAEIDPIIELASQEAREKKISGQALTPFLLRRINELTSGKSMRTNIAFLLNNARLGAQIAKAMMPTHKVRAI